MSTIPTLTIKIGSWNMKQFTTKNKLKISNIIQNISEVNPDILAMQEIQDIEAVKIVVENLGSEWDFISHKTPTWKAKNFQDYHAFIFKKSIAQPLGCFSHDNDRDKYYIGNNGLFHKSPVYCSFLIKDQCNITIVSVHTKSDVPMRDIQNLKYCVKAIKKTNKNLEKMIVLGDFNAPVDSIGFERLIGKGKYNFKPVLDSGINTNLIDTSQYDNILYNKHISKVSSNVSRPEDRTVETHSDHCLVYAELQILNNSPIRHFNRPNLHDVYTFKKIQNTQKNTFLNTFLGCFRTPVEEEEIVE